MRKRESSSSDLSRLAQISGKLLGIKRRGQWGNMDTYYRRYLRMVAATAAIGMTISIAGGLYFQSILVLALVPLLTLLAYVSWKIVARDRGMWKRSVALEDLSVSSAIEEVLRGRALSFERRSQSDPRGKLRWGIAEIFDLDAPKAIIRVSNVARDLCGIAVGPVEPANEGFMRDLMDALDAAFARRLGP